MNINEINSDLKKQGIIVTSQINTLTVNSIAKSVSHKIVETFPDFSLTESHIFSKLAKLNMYKAHMPEGIAEACYYYKTESIYFNEHIDDQDLEEFAIHECIHYLQEHKDINNKLVRMGLSDYTNRKPEGVSLNEAATQFTASKIIGITPDFEKYYNISLYTPSPSYYPLECSLLNEITYFVGEDVLFKSTLFSNDNFKNEIIDLTSKEVFIKLEKSFDQILNLEEKLVKLESKISSSKEGSATLENIMNKIEVYKQKIANCYFNTQNIIIENFFNGEFNKITNLEELENFRRKLYKFTDIIGSNSDYTYFDSYYVEMMNKLEHKCNILENGGVETALSNTSSANPFLKFLSKLLKLKASRKTAQ